MGLIKTNTYDGITTACQAEIAGSNAVGPAYIINFKSNDISKNVMAFFESTKIFVRLLNRSTLNSLKGLSLTVSGMFKKIFQKLVSILIIEELYFILIAIFNDLESTQNS